jgi:hypothetical protein
VSPFRSLRGRLARPIRAAACVLALASAVPATAFGLATGDKVALSGTVTDTGGRPLVGLRVVLEASRKSLRPGENEVRRVAASTDARGSYSISWPWDPYFNRFEIQVGVAIRRGKEERFEVFERQSLSVRQMEAGVVTVPLIVQSEDERRVFAELGQPDEVRIVEYPNRRESTWWYFESGRAYRFEAGRLAQVIHFDPIRKF